MVAATHDSSLDMWLSQNMSLVMGTPPCGSKSCRHLGQRAGPGGDGERRTSEYQRLGKQHTVEVFLAHCEDCLQEGWGCL